MGPIALYDKSFLQSLSTDESVWFDNFFYPVTCPIFIAETLADLWKKPRQGKTAEEEVGIIAAKTPQLQGGPCHFHRELYLQDLLGNHVPLTGQIPMAGIRRVVHEGREGAVAEVSPERKAFDRWQNGDFRLVERQYGSAWREQVEKTDLTIIEQAMKQFGVNAKTCKTLDAAYKLASDAVMDLTKTSGRFDHALAALNVPADLAQHIKERWKKRGKPTLGVFAPYAAYVLHVELFFRVALGANLIASTRPSNKVDMAYLFYLPFCMLFVSSDRLHRECGSLFLRKNQGFVWGADLKADLKELNTHFAALPDETKAQGIFKFANRLPDESHGLIRQIFETHTPNLLKPQKNTDLANKNAMADKKLLEELKGWENARDVLVPSPISEDELQTMIIKRSVSRQRGSWLQFGPEIGNESGG